jgi:hypothetical protein
MLPGRKWRLRPAILLMAVAGTFIIFAQRSLLAPVIHALV